MLQQYASAAENFVALLKLNTVSVLLIIGGLWAFNLVNWLVGSPLNHLGIKPRQIGGIPGIIFAPFLHGNPSHLFFNSIPLFFLLNFVLLAGQIQFIIITVEITLLSGVFIWLIGRPAIHLGASALVMGYWSYLLLNAYQHPTIFSIILVIVMLYYLGGLIINLFPSEPGVSWEGHVAGFVAGLVVAYYPLLF